jgi:threonine synthase
VKIRDGGQTARRRLQSSAMTVRTPAAVALPAEPGAPGIWRHAPLLPPLDAADRVSLDEGQTPLVALDRAGEAVGLTALWGKDEARNPSGTFKDRCLAVCASVARATGAPGIVCASTGNAGASAAAYGARAGLPVLILVPTGTPPAKLAQAAVCGARVVAVEGTYSDAHGLARALADDRGWLNATTTFVCPHVVTGARTLAFELAEAVGAPDWVVVPIGAGPLLVGVHEGYAELVRRGLVARPPRLLAVQPRGCAPIVRAFAEDAPVRAWEAPQTIASGLADPLAGYEEEGEITLRAIRASGGAAVAVDDERTLAMLRLLAAREGLFQEPSGAIAVAGAEAARRAGTIAAGETVAAVLTGTGLKTPQAVAGDITGTVVEIDADVDALLDELGVTA